jgi:peroxiredoxin
MIQACLDARLFKELIEEDEDMNKIQVLIGAGLLLALLLSIPPSAEDASGQSTSLPLRPGDPLPSLSFSNSLTSNEKKYLGIGEKKVVSLQNVQGDLLILFVLNSYCPICATSLATFKEVFETIEANRDLKKRIKVIGISVGDTPMEVSAFRERHAIPYPIIPDTEFEVHKKLKEPAVPFILVAKKDRNGRWGVAKSQFGVDFSAESLVDELKIILVSEAKRPVRG